MATAVSFATVLVEAIADVEGVAPEELDFQLYHELDVDALESLVEGGRSPVTVRTTVDGHEVCIDRGGVEVDGRRYDAEGV